KKRYSFCFRKDGGSMFQALMREVHFRSDFYALGHFSLFLLYAGYESNEKHEKPWYDELTLENYNREMLMRMLQIKNAVL
ncbi:hypothetical protein QBJ84_18720, partial [Vibrio sp. NO3-D2]|nr:hypothetical protein [Vibrio sp. NO3-D2]